MLMFISPIRISIGRMLPIGSMGFMGAMGLIGSIGFMGSIAFMPTLSSDFFSFNFSAFSKSGALRIHWI